MSFSRSGGSRGSKRSLKPALDGRLEDRVVLSSMTPHEYMALSQRLLNNPSPRLARVVGFPAFLKNAPGVKESPLPVNRATAIQTIRGGQAVNVAYGGAQFRIQLSYISNTQQAAALEGAAGLYAQGSGGTALGIAQPTELPQAQGTVRVYPMAGGMVGIIVDGSTDNTELSINPLPQPIRKGYAHSFAYGQGSKERVLKIGQITINSGEIGSIVGFHTADLAGPVVVEGTRAIDRMAFRSILPGASIKTGGDVNTLDILQGVHLSGGNIDIGRDLNLLNVGGDIVLDNGANILIARDMGLTLQPPKGTGTGSNVQTLNVALVGTDYTGPPIASLSAYLQGNVVVNPGSLFSVGRAVDKLILVKGDVNGASRVTIPQNNTGFASPVDVIGDVTP